MLKDPAVPDDDKQAVLHTLRMLARVQRRAQT
jgi:hypothetical protein